MTGLLRVTGLIGGLLLVVMGMGGSVLRQEPSEAYWMVTGTAIGTFPDSYARVDISHPDGTPFHEAYQFTNSRQQTKYFAGWSPNGRWAYYLDSSDDGRLRLLRESVDGRRSAVLVDMACLLHQNFQPIMSADQRWTAMCERTTRDNQVQEDLLLFAADGRNQRRLNPDQHIEVVDVHWSSDGKYIYYNAMDADGNGFYQVNLDTGQHRQLYDRLIDPVFSPDASQIAFLEVAGIDVFSIKLLSSGSGEVSELITTDRPFQVLAWLPNDVILLYQRQLIRGENLPQLATFDLATNTLTTIAEGVNGPPSITPDQRAAHYILWEMQSYVLYRLDLETFTTQKRYQSEARFELVYEPNRPWLLVFEGNIMVTHNLLIYDLTTEGKDLGEPIVRFPLWTLESTLAYPPSDEWVIAEHYVGTSTIAIIHVDDNSYSILPNRWVVGFSPLIDLAWSNTRMFSIGAILLLGAIVIMGLRVRRMTA